MLPCQLQVTHNAEPYLSTWLLSLRPKVAVELQILHFRQKEEGKRKNQKDVPLPRLVESVCCIVFLKAHPVPSA